MNPMKLLQIKSALDRFKANHPKFPRYLSAVYQKGLRKGTLMEFKVTTPEGEELSANIRLNEEDIALFREMKELFQNQ
ncbi:MAG: hypothetical protein MR868_08325 [Lachnospiraceae bacterium]|nr:hypothetical protein [Lachnospiraceae bacterium]